MSDQDSRLPPRAEALLVAFSTPDRDFDALAARIDEAVKATAIGSTPDDLLGAPLPNEPGEEDEAPPPPVAAPRLSDLARAVAQKKGDAADADLARETLSVASKLRSQTDVLIERMRAAPRAAEPPLRPNSAAQPPEERAVAPARAADVVPLAPAPAVAGAEPKKPALRSMLWGGTGLSLAAAMALLVFGRQSEKAAPDSAESPAAVAAETRAAPAVATAAPPADEKLERGMPQETPPPTEATETGGAIARAESQTGRARNAAPLGGSSKGRAVSAEKVELDEAPAAAAKPKQAAKQQAQAATPPPTNAGPARDESLKPASGKTDDGMLPDKPSTGAVQAAMASVMNAARACVAGSTETTPVTVTFSANGSVKSVAVSGAAQGTPAAKCIQSALGRAKVAPFAQPAFSVGVSVRP